MPGTVAAFGRGPGGVVAVPLPGGGGTWHDARVTPPMGNRRIDRVLAPDFLEDLPGKPIDAVRAMRRDAEQEETDLSYLRRLVQGRIDILRSEQARRSGSGAAEAEASLAAGEGDAPLVERLASILTDDGEITPPRGLGRHIAVEPSRADMHRRHVEALIADTDMSDPANMSDPELERILVLLESEERKVSDQRRAVQAVMDACTAEIGRRYRDGDVDVDGLLPTESR